MLRTLIILFCVALFAPKLFAEQEYSATYSLSKQFVVYGPKGTPAQLSGKKLVLDPAFLTVSCERIKQSVWAEINAREYLMANTSNSGEGKIFVVLHPGAEQFPLITPIQTLSAFNYRIDLPNRIEGAHLIEAVTEAVLLEMANRHSEGNFAQLPRWLASGIAEMVKADSPETLLLQPNFPISRARIHQDPLANVRKNLENYTPLTFDELSWPGNLSADRARHYDECAHLFVHELLALKNGENSLKQMIEGFSSHLNWQVAFLRAFRPHFQQLVDVEKWWGLRVVGLSGRDASQLWSREQSMEQVDAAVLVPVQKFSTNSGPNHGDLSLQEIVSKWEPEQQKLALPKVLNQLRTMRARVQPEFVKLIDDYCAALENFSANERKSPLKRIFSRDNPVELRQLTCEQLDGLDRKRTELRNRPRPSTREEAILSALEATADRKVPAKR